jgi:hypothetical protein
MIESENSGQSKLGSNLCVESVGVAQRGLHAFVYRRWCCAEGQNPPVSEEFFAGNFNVCPGRTYPETA